MVLRIHALPVSRISGFLNSRAGQCDFHGAAAIRGLEHRKGGCRLGMGRSRNLAGPGRVEVTGSSTVSKGVPHRAARSAVRVFGPFRFTSTTSSSLSAGLGSHAMRPAPSPGEGHGSQPCSCRACSSKAAASCRLECGPLGRAASGTGMIRRKCPRSFGSSRIEAADAGRSRERLATGRACYRCPESRCEEWAWPIAQPVK